MNTTAKRVYGQSDVRVLTSKLRQLARQMGPESKLPTVRELCQSLGTHTIALDGALELLEAQDIICRRQGSGIFVSSKINTKSIVVLLDSTFFCAPGVSRFWGMLWGLLLAEAQQRSTDREQVFQFRLVLESEDQHQIERELFDQIDEGRLHAIIAIGFRNHVPTVTPEQAYPMVAFAGVGHWFVELDQVDIVHSGVRALADQGCRRIAVWNPAPQFRGPELRRNLDNALQTALRELDLPYTPEWVRDNVEVFARRGEVCLKTAQRQGYELALELFRTSKGQTPDGVVIMDDMMTAGSIAAFHKLKLTLGHDVKIASHANKNSESLCGYEDQLIQLEYDPQAIINEIFAMVDVLLAGGTPPAAMVTVKPKLILPHAEA